jgi:flagellar biosynthesis/type III secretory pathway ATPase
LLSMLAKHGDANALVLGLIGERGREVKRPRSSSRG